MNWLTEIESRCEKATPGPWETCDAGPWGGQGVGLYEDKPEGQSIAHFGKHTTQEHIRNGDFCAHAREDIPLLISTIRELRKALEQQKEHTSWSGAILIDQALSRLEAGPLTKEDSK